MRGMESLSQSLKTQSLKLLQCLSLFLSRQGQRIFRRQLLQVLRVFLKRKLLRVLKVQHQQEILSRSLE